MKTKKIIINGVELFSERYNNALVSYDIIDEVETIEDAKTFIESLLYSYVKEFPHLGTWSIGMDTMDGHAVELRWSCNSIEEHDEFLTTFVDGERLYDQKFADSMCDAYVIGDAKQLLASTTVEEWKGIGIEWFNEHVAYVANYFEDDFTKEQHEEVKRISNILK